MKCLKLLYNARLDQASNEAYSCPTCRKPLVVGRTESETNPRGREVLLDEQLARQLSSGLDQQNTLGHSLPLGVFPNQTQNLVDGGGAWRFAFVLCSFPCMIAFGFFF